MIPNVKGGKGWLRVKIYFKKYLNWIFKLKWMFLQIPIEFKSNQERIRCLKETKKHIIKHTKIIK